MPAAKICEVRSSWSYSVGYRYALQNWEPDMRRALRDAGFLTRDSRVMEKKKPGKPKARKSFQWVKPSGNSSPRDGDDVDVREEYANAFRTESYNQFWTRVIYLSCKKSTSSSSSPIESSSTSARLMSYRLFAHNLLEPDQNTVTRILDVSRVGRPTRTLLSDYFLKQQTLSCFAHQFTELSRWFDPFISSGSRIQLTRTGCLNLLKRLESSRDKTRAKLKLINGLTHSSGLLVLALTTTLIVTIASHAFALLIAGPTLLTGRFKPVGLRKKLMKTAARLDVAAKGTYILSRDLDTISRLVTRINDEVEHVRAMAEFWAGRGSGRRLMSLKNISTCVS
ncbi:hypothetical protein Bca52824_000753 [Brassica carinata]|uniref:Uncharacterized protein n=1 Tax=Brassica carinata TaxID=52824 RepID=A0A8X8BCN2_BRACI|nr:hypothetical protein Bca52824_000753 [Brassica carinata]